MKGKEKGNCAIAVANTHPTPTHTPRPTHPPPIISDHLTKKQRKSFQSNNSLLIWPRSLGTNPQDIFAFFALPSHGNQPFCRAPWTKSQVCPAPVLLQTEEPKTNFPDSLEIAVIFPCGIGGTDHSSSNQYDYGGRHHEGKHFLSSPSTLKLKPVPLQTYCVH